MYSKAKGKRQKAKVTYKNLARLLTFAFLLLPFALTLPACGRRRPPVPPVEAVPQRTELLSGIQRGNQVILSWPAPLRNPSDTSVQSIRRIDIYRLAEPVNAPLPITEEEFGERATLIGSVPFENITTGGGTITYNDELTISEPVRLRYSIRFVNASGQRAAFSNFLLIEPAARVSRPPVLDQSPGLAESAITIRWQAPAANVDGSTPVNLLGYNVYRVARSQGLPAQTPINGQTPTTATTYADQNFLFGEEYTYVVRAVSLGTGGNSVESLNSNAVSVTNVDTFPPSPPSGISAAAASGRLSLFFAANPERDVAGYNVYRSTDPNLPKASWTKLNRALHERTTFHDETVQSGTRYYYYLTAVDNVGNVSGPSEVVSETAP